MAMDLYLGPIFQDRKNYAIATGQPWYILSGLYGLICPLERCDPYDFALAKQPRAYRQKWAAKVVRRLLKLEDQADQLNTVLEIHAGAAYAIPLMERPKTHTSFRSVLWPVKGLSQGHQRQWYKQERQQS